MRSIDPILQAALKSGSYSPFFQVTISDTYTGLIHVQSVLVGYKLDDLELTFTIQQPYFLDVPYYRTSVVLTRGVTIDAVNYTEDTSKFTIIDSTWDGSFQTFNCHLIPRVKCLAAGDDTYDHVITAFLARFGFTPVYLEPAAEWLNYQFYPAGKTLNLNDARQFFNILRQKYFIFATDNGNNEILFYTPFSHVADPQYATTGYHFALDYNVGQKRQYMWRDEIESLHYTSPEFKSMGQISGGAGTIVSLYDLGAGVILAGTLLTYHAHIFRSVDHGEHWDAGLDLNALGGLYTSVTAFLSPAPGIVLAFGWYYGFVLRSEDYGATWVKTTNIGLDSAVAPVDLGNGDILIGHTSSSGLGCEVYKSLDYGLTWQMMQKLGAETAIYSMAYLGNGVVVAGTGPNAAVYRSTDYGNTWGKVQNLANAVQINCFLPMGGGVIWAGTQTDGRLYKSLDNGVTWEEFAHFADGYIFTLSTLGGGILLAGAGAGGNVYRSVDNGGSWSVLQKLGSETQVRSFLTMGNGSTLAGTSPGGYIYKSLNCSADLDPIHNLGFLPSTAKEPSAYFQLAPAKFDPFPVNLKYQSSDFIRVNLIQGGIYDITCAQVSEVLDLSLKAMPWQMIISPAQWLTNTAVGPLPGTIARVSSYTPLVTANFNRNLSPAINNLQALADAVDDMILFPEAPKNGTPYLRQDASWVSPVPPVIREKLSASRTYYVRTDGYDGNTGLANTAGGAFLTIQKAIDTVATLDINAQTVTIQVADGTYTISSQIVLKNVIGFAAAGNLIIRGNNSVPSNVIINQTTGSTYIFYANALNVIWQLLDMKLTGGYFQIGAETCSLNYGNLNFGTCSQAHIEAGYEGEVTAISSYSISGGAAYHAQSSAGGAFIIWSKTVTFIANVTFSGGFVMADRGASISIWGVTFTLGAYAVTGPRFLATLGGVIWTNNAGLTYFPSSVAGTLTSGGVYDTYTAYPGKLDIYPIGAVIFRVDNTNPGTLYGGTWASIGSGSAFGLTVATSIWIWKRTA